MLLNDANDIYVGKAPIKKVCVGNKNIWIKKNYSLEDFLRAFNDFNIKDDENFNDQIIGYYKVGCTISRDVLGGGTSDELNNFPIMGFRITNNPTNLIPFSVTITVNEENVTENTPKMRIEFTGSQAKITKDTFKIFAKLHKLNKNTFCYIRPPKKPILLNNIKFNFRVYSYQDFQRAFYDILDYVNIELLTVEDNIIKKLLNN